MFLRIPPAAGGNASLPKKQVVFSGPSRPGWDSFFRSPVECTPLALDTGLVHLAFLQSLMPTSFGPVPVPPRGAF